MANICWMIEKVREFQKNIYFCFIGYAKAFDWITTNCGKFLEMGISDHLTFLLRNLYAGQEATVRTGHGTESLLLNQAKMPGFLAPGGKEFNLGPEMRLDHSELLCNKVLLKYKGDRESF